MRGVGVLRASLLAFAVLATTAGGCVTSGDDDNPVEGSAGDSSSWDLTEPPTRAEVGLQDGQPVAAYATDEGREVSFALPDDVELVVEARLVTWEAFLAEDPDTGDPTSAVATSPLVDLRTGTAWFRESLATLGLPAAEVDRWLDDVEAARRGDDSAPVQSQSVGGELGFLRAGVQARYAPLDEKVRINWSFTWGDLPPRPSES